MRAMIQNLEIPHGLRATHTLERHIFHANTDFRVKIVVVVIVNRLNHLHDVIRALDRKSNGVHRAHSRRQLGHSRQLDLRDSTVTLNIAVRLSGRTSLTCTDRGLNSSNTWIIG